MRFNILFYKKWIIPTIFQHFYLTIFSQLNIFFLWNICFHNIFIFRFNFFHIVQTATLAKTQHFPLCSSFNNVSLPFDNSTFFLYVSSIFHYSAFFFLFTFFVWFNQRYTPTRETGLFPISHYRISTICCVPKAHGEGHKAHGKDVRRARPTANPRRRPAAMAKPTSPCAFYRAHGKDLCRVFGLTHGKLKHMTAGTSTGNSNGARWRRRIW